jgi:hypothetical protein
MVSLNQKAGLSMSHLSSQKPTRFGLEKLLLLSKGSRLTIGDNESLCRTFFQLTATDHVNNVIAV